MVNEIKLDNISPMFTKEAILEDKSKQTSSTVRSEDVTVTNGLHGYIKSINDFKEPVSSTTLSEIKQKIQTGTYEINFDLLSEKLINSGAVKVVGE